MPTTDTPIASIVSTDSYQVMESHGLRCIRHRDDPNFDLSTMWIDRPDLLTFPYLVRMMEPLVLIDAPRDAIMLGLGSGQMAKFIRRYVPAMRVKALEIDPVMVELARSAFGLPPDDERLEVVIADAAAFIERYTGQCDLLFSDAYDEASRPIDAFHSESFYRACHRVLRQGGIMTVNMFRPEPGWRTGYLEMLQSIFELVYVTTVLPDQFVLTLCKNRLGPDWQAIEHRAAAFDASAGLDLVEFVRRIPRV